MDSNHRRLSSPDLQSGAINHSTTYPYEKWCALKDSNLGPTGYEPVALTNWAKGAGAGSGNRTRIASLEGWNSTIELHLHYLFCGTINIINFL